MSTHPTIQTRTRATNRETLLDAAEAVFLRHGITPTTMQQIAEHAGLSRVTLYKHFRGKDELIFAIEMRILGDFHRYTEHQAGTSGTAGAQLQRKLYAYSEYFRAHKHHFRFVGLFDHHYATSYPSSELARQYHEFLASFTHTERLLAAGLNDGSIAPDIDPYEMAAYIGNVFVATAHRIAARENILASEQGISMHRLIEIFIQQVLQAILQQVPRPQGANL